MANGRILIVGVLVVATLSVWACRHGRPRDDSSVVKEIQAKLYQDATLKTRDISVIANDGVIVLIGQVSSEDERASAERLTGAVQGVRQVINQLVVVEASPPPPAPVQHSPAPGRSKRPVAGAPPT